MRHSKFQRFVERCKKDSGPFFILVASSLWALDGVIRHSLYSLLPIVIIFFEHLIGFVLWMMIMLGGALSSESDNGTGSDRQLANSFTEVSKKSWGLAILVALLSGLLGTLMFTSALQKVEYIDFSVVMLLQKLQPIFAILTAKVLLKEKLSSGYWRWALLALVAAYFVTFPNGSVNFETDSDTVMAGFLAVGAAVTWGSSTVFSKLLIRETSPSLATGLRFGLTTLFSGLVIFWMGKEVWDVALSINLIQLSKFALIAISTGMTALWLYYRGLEKTKASVSTILELWFPVLAIAVGGVMYGQWLSVTQLVAVAVMIWAIRGVVQS